MNLANWGILLMHIHPRSQYIVLHYTLSFGVDRLGPWYEAFYIPILGLLLILIHVTLAEFLSRRSSLLTSFFLVLMPFFQFFLFFASLFLIIVNLPVKI